MDSKRLSLYQRLRDFKIPSTILDAIFENDGDLEILENAFDALLKDGFKEDEAAEEISKMIFNELDIEPDQSFNVEK
tara:strand:+ start:148 stop:378 length:231 start_codon:yes stop_codon:yes gene_type:complete